MWPLKTVHVAVFRWNVPYKCGGSIRFTVFYILVSLLLFFFPTHRWEWDSKVSSHYCWIVFFLPSILSVFVECVLATLLLWAHMCIVTLASSWMWLFLLQKLFISSNNFCFHVYFLWYFSSLMVTVCMVISSFYLFASNLLISLN